MSMPLLSFWLVVLSCCWVPICGQSVEELTGGSDRVVAVSIGDIKSFGIVTQGWQKCDQTDDIIVYFDSALTISTRSIENHSFVKYDRLSELIGRPYWAPRREHALAGGEKFRIRNGETAGWIDDEQLMTFSSARRDRRTDRFFAIAGGVAACLYSSGQFGTAACAALTLWKRANFENVWSPVAITFDPVDVSLYTFPEIESVIGFNQGDVAILVQALGGDAEDCWGAFAYYLYRDTILQEALTKRYSYTADRPFTKPICKLVQDEAGDPIGLLIQEHYEVDVEAPGYTSNLVATDTTVLNLLE